jgi:hypothetical protein
MDTHMASFEEGFHSIAQCYGCLILCCLKAGVDILEPRQP